MYSLVQMLTQEQRAELVDLLHRITDRSDEIHTDDGERVKSLGVEQVDDTQHKFTLGVSNDAKAELVNQLLKIPESEDMVVRVNCKNAHFRGPFGYGLIVELYVE